MKYHHLIILFLLFLLSSYRLFRPGYFSMQDDIHVFRLQQFDQCLRDGQIPCRYVPLAGMGYGYPLFNFYSPFPYALAEIFHIVGLSFIDSLKLVFILGFFLSLVGMYFLANCFWKGDWPLVCAAFYLFSPYRAIDSYVRGALAEFIALALLPVVFYSAIKSITTSLLSHRLLFIVSLCALLLSHNLTSLVTIPFLFIFLTLVYGRKSFLVILLSAISFSLSAFFLIPAIFESRYVTLATMTQGYFNFVNHFATLNQLFVSRFWGFGASLWGPKDDMSFQVGLLHWLVPIVGLFLSILSQSKNRLPLFVIILSLSSIFFLFLTHNRSTFIWQSFSFMPFFQFPWRFLGFTAFSLSLLAGQLSHLKNKLFRQLLPSILIFLVVALNLSFFKEDLWFPNLTDAQKLSGENLIAQSGAGIQDYWPIYGKNYPKSFATQKPVYDQTKVTLLDYQKTSHQFVVNLQTASDSTILLPLVYFPGWQAYLNQRPHPFTIETDLGLIQTKIPPGLHRLDLVFTNTPIRNASNLISLFSIATLLLYLIKTSLSPKSNYDK